jgi:hypothetical protein
MPLPRALLQATAQPPRMTRGTRRPAEDELDREPSIAQDALTVYAKTNGKRAKLDLPSMSRLVNFVKVSTTNRCLRLTAMLILSQLSTEERHILLYTEILAIAQATASLATEHEEFTGVTEHLEVSDQ